MSKTSNTGNTEKYNGAVACICVAMRWRGLIEDAVSPASFERHLRGRVANVSGCNAPASSEKLWGRPAWPRRQASALEAKKRFTTARSFLLELKPYSVRIGTRSFKVFKLDLVFNCLKTSFHCQMRGPKTYIIIWQSTCATTHCS